MIKEIKPYESKYCDGVIGLLKNLWPWEEEERYAHFNWEYYGNPIHPEPLAVIAVNEVDEVIGFRGWVPGVVYSEGKKYLVARAADAVVSPLCRRQGVFSKMTVFSIEYLRKNGVDAILNLTSNSQSNPGNLKLGWNAIGQLNIWYKIVCPHRKNYLEEAVVINKNGYRIELIPNIPNELKVGDDSDLISFSLAEGQLGWIGKKPGEKYLTALALREDGLIDSLFVFSINHGRKTSLQYLKVNDVKIAKQTFHLVCKYFTTGIISVWGMALSEKNAQFLKKVGFIQIPFYEKLRKKPPILVRTIGNPAEQQGWILGKKDIRDIRNWQLMSLDSF